MKSILFIALLWSAVSVHGQVKIGDNPNTIDGNSLLELESTNKGFLPPRMALNSAASIAPLTGTVPSGMMVYSSGGTLADGYYYWNGTSWRLVATSNLNAVAKTASGALTKAETMVLASNDIILTLPAITASDNGLAIVVKHIGSHTDLVVVKGNGGATIDGKDSSTLTRWNGRTYIAYNGNWVKMEQKEGVENLLDVSPTGSWTTIQEAVEFLNIHMTGPAVIRLSGGSFPVAATQVIDLPFPLTFQGLSFGKATIEAASGLSGPMFRALSECYFKMLAFDATTLGGYSAVAGNDAIQLETGGEYYEIKDCNFTGFNKTIVLESNVELWLFETDINDAVAAGVEIAAGATSGVSFKTSETDFINCGIGIDMLSGSGAIISILNCGFYNTGAQVGVNYVPGVGSFDNFTSMFITNNSWNNIGTYFSGFDFTRSDGRDSKAFLQNNAGDGNKNPTCYINVLNNAVTTTLGVANSWSKVDWNSAVTSTFIRLWTVLNTTGGVNFVNRITYQPTNHRGGYFIISGNLSVGGSSRTISIGIVKNGSSTVRFGETTVRTGSANTPTQFSTNVHLSDIGPNDYFEIFCSSSTASDVVKLQDLQWYADTK